MREMALSDFTSGMSSARDTGIAIGEQRKRIKYILKLSQKGLPAVEIARLTDLSVKDVERILQAT
jgi:hypothetical protein